MYKYNPHKRRRALKGYVLPDEKAERRIRRVRWRRIFIALALVGIIAAAVWVYRSPLLRVKEVEVVGAANTTPERVAQVADLEGFSMFNAPLSEAEERILKLPLVRAVDARVRWPNKVQIEVMERQPWGFWSLAGTMYPIDTEGVVMPAEVAPPRGSPVIHDVGGSAVLSPGDAVDTDAVQLAQALLALLSDRLALAVQKFEYTPQQGLIITTDAQYRVVLGDSQNIDYKLSVWKAVEDDIGRGAMAGHVLDLRFRDRPSYQ